MFSLYIYFSISFSFDGVKKLTLCTRHLAEENSGKKITRFSSLGCAKAEHCRNLPGTLKSNNTSALKFGIARLGIGLQILPSLVIKRPPLAGTDIHFYDDRYRGGQTEFRKGFNVRKLA